MDLLEITLYKLVQSLDESPQDWRGNKPVEPSHLIHKTGTVKLWIASGPHLWEPQIVRFGWRGTPRLHKAVRRWLKTTGAVAEARAQREAMQYTIKALSVPKEDRHG